MERFLQIQASGKVLLHFSWQKGHAHTVFSFRTSAHYTFLKQRNLLFSHLSMQYITFYQVEHTYPANLIIPH